LSLLKATEKSDCWGNKRVVIAGRTLQLATGSRQSTVNKCIQTKKMFLKEVQHSSKGTTDDHIEVISIIRTVFLFEESQGLQNTLHFSQLGWRRSSVVRTSVFGRQTFPDLCPIYGWQVTTLWVNCPLWVSQPGQLSLPSRQGRQTGSNPRNYMQYYSQLMVTDYINYGGGD